jgi:HEAT repeat protein
VLALRSNNPKAARTAGGRRLLPWLWLLVSLAPAGCSGFWEDVTSHEFEFKSLYTKPPDPLVVLSQDKDGDHRRKALLRLQEPKTHGGTDADQDRVLNLLADIATKDPQPLCRLAAIRTLGTFKDPRAAQKLEAAYFSADRSRPDDSLTVRQVAALSVANHFTPETANLIKVQSIQAMGDTGNEAVLGHLVTVLRQPTGEGSDLERPANLDERIAAARALGHFSQAQATEALLKVLETDKDVALRDRAAESLQKITGKELPADFKAWNDFLHPPGGGAPPPPKPKKPWFDLF